MTESPVRQALLVIDVQCALFDPAPRPDDAEAVLQKINALASRARTAGVPVVFIQHEDDASLVFGSQGWALARHLHVHASDYTVRKTTPDSFLNTPLGDVLAQHGVTQLVVAGYASEFCVDTTVRRAAALGFGVVIAADAHTTHDKPHASAAQIRAHHNATLCDITSFGPKIVAVPSADIPLAH
jgi:nicotinamidase-related amidase